MSSSLIFDTFESSFVIMASIIEGGASDWCHIGLLNAGKQRRHARSLAISYENAQDRLQERVSKLRCPAFSSPIKTKQRVLSKREVSRARGERVSICRFPLGTTYADGSQTRFWRANFTGHDIVNGDIREG